MNNISELTPSGDNKEFILRVVINLILLSIILTSVFVSLTMNLGDRSLWLDEAMLAFSVSQRSLGDLTSEMLDWDQSAPVIYLYLVKVITVLLGNTEFTLRLLSFISFLLLMGAVYYFSRNILHLRYPLFGVAFIATLEIMLTYSNEFKPYMTDAFIVLFTIILYYLFREKRMNRYLFVSLLVAFVWMSNPCCFFIAAILIVEFIDSLIDKEYDRTRFIVLSGLAVFISFAVYYFFWLKPVIDVGFMSRFWKDYEFPLIPSDIAGVIWAKTLIERFFSHLGHYHRFIFFIVCAGFLLNLFAERNRYINTIFAGIAITLIASKLGMYPFQSRLCLFMYPLIAILVYFFIDKFFSGNKIINAVILSVSFVLLFSSDGIGFYKDREHLYRPARETNQAIDYIAANIKEDEKMYVFSYAVPGFLYKNKYDKTSVGSYENNVLLGNDIFSGGRNREDILLIVNNAPAYILTCHHNHEVYKPLIDSLRKRGHLELVYDRYATNVYHYSESTDVCE